MTKRTILFLAANPHGADQAGLEPQARRVALDLEASAIQKELRLSGYRDRFDFETRWAAAPLDLLAELRALKPTVVHFSGHGGPGGLFFQAPNGDAQIVSPAALAETFSAAGGSVKLIVLSACYGEAPAEALLAHVDCVVGVSGVLRDNMARAFAIGFYGALGEQASIAAAYQHGNAAISLEGLSDADRPQLKVRVGIDATQIILAAVAPEIHVALPCPYPGMQPYSADDADHFHGRGAEIDELIGRIRAGEREIYVVGPSGSGKSSLVTAGVLPRLARGVAGLGPFVVRSMRPGEHPAARLDEMLEVSARKLTTPAGAITALLAGRAASTSVLILIDQLEELFTLADAGERDRFLIALEALRAAPRCVLVFTLRADFYGAFMESPLRTGRPGPLSRIEVVPLRGEVLKEAIVRPARDLGVEVEPELIERLLSDTGSEPGILPLLQETLVQLWERRQGQTLTLADYEALGDRDRSGLAVAISRRADALLRDLSQPQQAIARRILLRLISFGEGRSDTRRQQPRSKLRASDDGDADFDLVLQRLIAGRLLTADEDHPSGETRIDLAHEVMIAAWPTLAGWIQTHRAEEQRRRQFEAAAMQWVEHGRSARGLLDPIELADAEAWQRTESACELGPSADVAALVAASRAAHDRQQRRRRGLVLSAYAGLAVLAVITTFWVMARDREREVQRLILHSHQETGRQLLLEGYSQEALPYLMAARKGGETTALRLLIWMATRSLPLIPALEHQGAVVSATFNHDGTHVVTASEDNHARIWDAVTGKCLAVLTHPGPVRSAAFSHDGTRVVTASEDATARVWDVATRKLIEPVRGHQQPLRSAAFNHDGTRIVTASEDTTARVWDAATGKPLGCPLEHQGPVRSAVFNHDGTRVVTASANTVRIWDVATCAPLEPPLQHTKPVMSAAFNHDGTRVVFASEDATARVWDPATGEFLSPQLQHQGTVRSAAFSRDGTRIVTASYDHTARIWDATTGEPISHVLAHQGTVWSAAFNHDTTRVITASSDNTARIWDATMGGPSAPIFKHDGAAMSAAFNHDGTSVVASSEDSTVRLWHAATGKHSEVPSKSHNPHPNKHWAAVRSTSFNHDGTRVVTASEDTTARIWDVATGDQLEPMFTHQGPVMSAAFNHDGTRVVTASKDNTVRIWDIAPRDLPPLMIEHPKPVLSAAFNHNGTRIITASEDKTARIWDATTGELLAPAFAHQGPVRSASFNHDGTRVVTASEDNTARIWDATTGELLVPALAHQHWVRSAVFSFDGKLVATASSDGTARIWDATAGKLLVVLKHRKGVRSAAFSPDGTRVVTAGADHSVRVWEIRLDETSPAGWPALAARSPFVLSRSALVPLGFLERSADPR